MNDFFLIAHITSTSGLDGFLKLQLITDFPDRLTSLKEVYLDFFNMKKKFIIEEIKRSNKSFLIKFERFYSERELNVLVGRDIYLSGKDISQLPEGSIFNHDLLNSEVWRDNSLLGRIKEILNLPANDIFVIIDEAGNELLIPFVLSFIEEFDIKKKRLILKSGAGLYEDDED
ncbi:MAG: ribosome maturation factor RimM [Ignavibacteriaceae bacterium]